MSKNEWEKWRFIAHVEPQCCDECWATDNLGKWQEESGEIHTLCDSCADDKRGINNEEDIHGN